MRAHEPLPVGETGGSRGQGQTGPRGITRSAQPGEAQALAGAEDRGYGPAERQRSLDRREGQSPLALQKWFGVKRGIIHANDPDLNSQIRI